MYYINSIPTENGNYGNPQSNGREDMHILPDELLSDYLDSMGFVNLTINKNNEIIKVERNAEASDAYQAQLPPPYVPTPAENRENAYNTMKIIEWVDKPDNITVTEAATLWEYYAAEGNEKIAGQLQTLIATAKAEIRAMYPDDETHV